MLIHLSSCAASMDFPDPLRPFVSIVHCSWKVFQTTSCISTELLYIAMLLVHVKGTLGEHRF